MQVVRKWRSLACRLSLSEYVVSIECWRGGGGRRRRGWREEDKLEMLLRMWKEKKPLTYHTDMLKTVLAEEVNMYAWLGQVVLAQPLTKIVFD